MRPNSTRQYTIFDLLKNGTYEDIWWGKWVYDNATNMLIFYYKETTDIEEAYYVVEVTESKLKGKYYDYEYGELDSSITTFVRISDSQIPIIYIDD